MTNSNQPKRKLKKWQKWTIGIIGSFIALMIIAVNSDDPNKDDPMKVAMSDKPENSKPDSIIHKKKLNLNFPPGMEIIKNLKSISSII